MLTDHRLRAGTPGWDQEVAGWSAKTRTALREQHGPEKAERLQAAMTQFVKDTSRLGKLLTGDLDSHPKVAAMLAGSGPVRRAAGFF